MRFWFAAIFQCLLIICNPPTDLSSTSCSKPCDRIQIYISLRQQDVNKLVVTCAFLVVHETLGHPTVMHFMRQMINRYWPTPNIILRAGYGRGIFTQLKTGKLQKGFWLLLSDLLSTSRVRMACDSLSTTSLLQVVNRLVASWFLKLVINGLLQVASTSCNKSDFNRLVATWWNW